MACREKQTRCGRCTVKERERQRDSQRLKRLELRSERDIDTYKEMERDINIETQKERLE